MTKIDKNTGNFELIKKNEELKELIRDTIKKNTPEKEIVFSEFIKTRSPDGTSYVCRAMTYDKRDDIPLLLDRKEFKWFPNEAYVRGTNSEDQEELRTLYNLNDFLEELHQKVKGEAEVNHRFLVEWTYKDTNKRKQDPKLKKSHFFGKDVNEVMEKINYSVGDDYEPEINKIELIPES